MPTSDRCVYFLSACPCPSPVTIMDEFSYPLDAPWHYPSVEDLRFDNTFVEAASELRACRLLAVRQGVD